MRFSTFRALTGILGLAVLSGPAQAESFTLFIYEAPSQMALRDDPGEAGQTYWAGYNQFAANLMQAGVLRGGTALNPRDITTLDTSGRRAGTYGASDRILGGYFVIETSDMSAAEALARQAPAVLTGAIEIHRNAPNPTQSAGMTATH
ncbi:hypothetical protein ABI_19270 [Asticcacaulis biprosthecium C19]|uniref:Uncharacterized protein n=1 Tax=Asticcacaulis biprosthecium C19 TaxID=715226 RepID=F4QLI9_9CAUL|nr:YciI family protein [Asticcacaulis biprosthecium]EGF93487.1 hypothetical protein ABI_19270 [Asticcacaulis biprosthecium C19]